MLNEKGEGRRRDGRGLSEALKQWVSFMILPLSYFALVNFQNKQREPTVLENGSMARLAMNELNSYK